MNVYWLDQMDTSLDLETVVCLGMFDGMHLGHQALIQEGRRVADKNGWDLCVHTYDILPVNFIYQRDKVAELTPLEEKLKLFEMYQVDLAAVDRFNDELLHMTGKAFFRDIVAGKLKARHVVAGFNHRFGYMVDSGTEELELFCQEQGIGLSIVQAVTTPSGDLVSSTAIREAIQMDKVDLASQMLGRTLDAAMVNRVKSI